MERFRKEVDQRYHKLNCRDQARVFITHKKAVGVLGLPYLGEFVKLRSSHDLLFNVGSAHQGHGVEHYRAACISSVANRPMC